MLYNKSQKGVSIPQRVRTSKPVPVVKRARGQAVDTQHYLLWQLMDELKMLSGAIQAKYIGDNWP